MSIREQRRVIKNYVEIKFLGAWTLFTFTNVFSYYHECSYSHGSTKVHLYVISVCAGKTSSIS